MKVEYIHEKGSMKLNEDQLVVSEPLFAVFDGATGFDGFTDKQGRTGALLASTAAAGIFKKDDKPFTELVPDANRAVEKEMRRHGIENPTVENLWMTTAISIRVQERSFDWAHIGDGNILVIHGDSLYTLLAGDVDHDRELFLKWLTLPGRSKKVFWEEMYEELIQLRRQANVSYGMLDGRQTAMAFVQSGTENLDKVRNIILFTDGLMIPKEDPRKDDDVDLFIQLFNGGGLKKIYEYTRSREREDSHLLQYPRAKQHDDATAIAITF